MNLLKRRQLRDPLELFVNKKDYSKCGESYLVEIRPTSYDVISIHAFVPPISTPPDRPVI